MKQLWIHVGMPKAGSTAIQYMLSSFLPSFDKRTLSYTEVSRSMKSSEAMYATLGEGWETGQLINAYSPVVLRSGETYLVSSENFSYFPASSLQSLSFKGLGVLREPVAWIQSMATQDILFSIPRNFNDFGKLFESGEVSNEVQLVNIIETYASKYLTMLENLNTWVDCSSQFHIIPYSAGPEFIVAVAEELAQLDIHVQPRVNVPIIRTSQSFETTQIALSVYAAARNEFECSRTKSCRLSQLALSIDPLVYRDNLVAVSLNASRLINEQLERAQNGYRKMAYAAGHKNLALHSKFPKFQVLDEEFSNALVSTLIRTSLGLIRAPESFNAQSYLDLNPELNVQGMQSGNNLKTAIKHYERHGFKESFPIVEGKN